MKNVISYFNFSFLRNFIVFFGLLLFSFNIFAVGSTAIRPMPATTMVAQTPCTSKATYSLQSSWPWVNGNTMYFYPYDANVTTTKKPLCPGLYYLHLYISLWAEQGGGSSGCGGYWCGVGFNGLRLNNNTNLIAGSDISARDYNYQPYRISIWTDKTYDPNIGISYASISTDSSNTIYSYGTLGAHKGWYNPMENYITICQTRSDC